MGLNFLSRHSPTAYAVGFILSPLRGWKALASSACLPAGLVLISPDNDIRNVVITLPSSYYGDGVRGFFTPGVRRMFAHEIGDPGKVLRRELFPEARRQDVRNSA